MTATPGRELPIIVIGAGHMGRIHAQRLSRSGRFVLAGVADTDREKAKELADSLKVPWADDFRTLAPSASAAIIATPTAQHYPIARALLDAGFHLLIEKPVADRLEDAYRLAELSRQAGRVTHVGHVEWFNPAVVAARSWIDRPRAIRALRQGSLRLSTADVDVVWDLMLHDLHIVRALLADPMPVRIEATGDQATRDKADVVRARLEFETCDVELRACRLSPTKARSMIIKQDLEEWTFDLLARRVSVRNSDGAIRSLPIDDWDAVDAEHAAFADALGGKETPEVSLNGVLPALELAARISNLLVPF